MWTGAPTAGGASTAIGRRTRCHAKGSNFAFRDASEAETARVTATTRGQQAAAESPPWPDRVTRR
jgi:hypothetical protein